MRKKLPTIFIAIFLCVFALQMVSIIFLLFTPAESQAINFEPQVKIPGSKLDKIIGPNSIGEHIKSIYNYAIGVVGILATAVMMLGGIVWITAGGNQTRIGEAKAWIGASLTGLILILTSYTILNMINPDLLNFKGINPEPPVIDNSGIKKICCRYEHSKIKTALCFDILGCNGDVYNNCSEVSRDQCKLISGGNFATTIGASCTTITYLNYGLSVGYICE